MFFLEIKKKHTMVTNKKKKKKKKEIDAHFHLFYNKLGFMNFFNAHIAQILWFIDEYKAQRSLNFIQKRSYQNSR